MSKVTKEQMEALRASGHRYSDIARVFGLSREMIRRYADQYGLKPRCFQCNVEIVSAKNKWCPRCHKEKRREIMRRSHRQLKTFSNRPVVGECYEFFNGYGFDVLLNAESRRGEPEVFVNGQGVKCARVVPLSVGHQVRLQPNDKTEWFYLSDLNGRRYVIPADEVTGKITYIGESHPLRKYGLDRWREEMFRGVFA